MSLKLKDTDPVKRMKDMQEELKDSSLGEFSDLEQDPYVVETTRTTPIEKQIYQRDGKLSSSSDRNPYIMSEEEQAELFGEDVGDKEIRQKSVRKEVLAFMLVGLAVLFGGLGMSVHNKLFLRKAETVQGEITHIYHHRSTNKVYVTYEVNGKSYTGLYHDDNEGEIEGQKVTVYYDPENPRKIADGRIYSKYFVFFVGVGAAMFLIGGYLVFWMNQNPDKGLEKYNKIFQNKEK